MDLILAEYIIELIERGNTMPSLLNTYEQVFIYKGEKEQLFITNGRGKFPITKEELKQDYISGKLTIGYNKALDKVGSRIHIGDTILYNNEKNIGEVEEIIYNLKELYTRKTGKEEYKTFYKYHHIIKPLLIIKPLYTIEENPITHLKEKIKVTKEGTEEISPINTILYHTL